MITHGRGLVCMPTTKEVLGRLGIDPMLTGDLVTVDTPFCVPIDHKGGTSGISAQDRALTVLSCTKADTKPTDFHRPGHIFPLRASENGVLDRRGHTEATVDLARLAGCAPVGMLCEILNADGTAARMDSLEEIAREHNLAITSIELLAQYREQQDDIIVLDDVEAEQLVHSGSHA
jgi:3,4-dihydroxy 2-butanone 4-phosphate synthase/GTP cyclohydrolase II